MLILYLALFCVHYIIESSNLPYQEGATCPILQVRKLRLRSIMLLVQSDMPNMWLNRTAFTALYTDSNILAPGQGYS